MPSLAQGCGQGLLSGLEIQERQRRLRQADLLDEYRKEQIADIRWEREKEKKSLLAQIKTEEEQAKRQKEKKEIQTGVAHLGMQPGGSYTVGKLLEEAPETVREPLYSALDLVPGLTSGQQLQRTRVEEKVEGAPGAIPFLGQYLPEEIRPEVAEIKWELRPGAGTIRSAKEAKPKRMTPASYRSQASSLEARAGKSTDITEIKSLFEQAKTLREEADKLFRQEQQRAGMIPDIPFAPTRVTPVGLEEEEPPEVEEPPIELPPSLIDELAEFESFEDWYEGLSPDAQEELDIEPETLKAIRDWYAVSR